MISQPFMGWPGRKKKMYYRIRAGHYDFKEREIFRAIHIVKELQRLRYDVQFSIVFEFRRAD